MFLRDGKRLKFCFVHMTCWSTIYGRTDLFLDVPM